MLGEGERGGTWPVELSGSNRVAAIKEIWGYNIGILTRRMVYEIFLREGGVRRGRRVEYLLAQVGGRETLLSAIFEDFRYMLDSA